MREEEKAGTKPIIVEIKQKIRLLNAIAAFIVITLLAVILRYLFKPAAEVLNFLPDVSITLIIAIVIVLTIIGFYIWAVVSGRIIRSIEKYRNRLDRILKITSDLREEIYGDVILDKIMDYSISITQSDAGSILINEDNNLVFKIVKGDKSAELTGTTVPEGKGIAGWVAENGKPLRIADVKSDERFDPEVDAVTGYETKSVLCIPLMIRTKVIGVIELLNKKDGYYSEKDEEMITYLADQAAISFARAKFYEDQKNYEIHITDILLDAIDFHILEKTGHSKRVAKYSNIIAKAINMSEEEKKRLYFASLLHDVGFLRIRADESYQREQFMKHPVIGYEMISPINFYADVAPFILYHHERYDGLGYPKRLKGEAIPLESRIIAIAEAFDAMVSETSYKVPLDFHSAVEELKRNAGTQFDFWLVDVFSSNITPELL
jgi:HD-GYP domain-containing protein (c-di-GMP phosphodiesterase class II)